MTDRKREPLANLKPPKFMKPGDDPELDRALDRLRFNSDIYAPGEYDVFGRRRNLKGLRPSQRDLPPWGTPPQEGTEPIARPESAEPIVRPESAEPTASPGTIEPSAALEHAELAAPPVASPAGQPTVTGRRRIRPLIAALAVFAALVTVTVVLTIRGPRVNPRPPQTSASAPTGSAVAAPTKSATPRVLATAEVSSGAPPIRSAVPAASAVPATRAAAPPAPSPSHAPTGKVKPRGKADDPYDAPAPAPPATAAPAASAPRPELPQFFQ